MDRETRWQYFNGRVSEEDRERLAYMPTICDLLEKMKKDLEMDIKMKTRKKLKM